MQTLKEIVVNQKIRKGPAAGTTKRGAFWLAEGLKTVIRQAGGNGVGDESPDLTYTLNIRHYRSGEVSAFVRVDEWHQNTGQKHRYVNCSKILDCTTVEEVVVTLKGVTDEHGGPVFSDLKTGDLTKVLTAAGLLVSLPAPDEE